MVKLIQSILSLLFFCFLFGLLWVKRQPNRYCFTLEKKFDYPMIAYAERLNQRYAVSNSTPQSFSKLTNWIKKEDIQRLSKGVDSVVYKLPTQLNFSLFETWRFTSTQNQVTLEYSFSPSLYSKLLLLWNSEFVEVVREALTHRQEAIEKEIENEFNTHRWNYVGEKDFPMTYYLAIEGESQWQEAVNSYQAGQKQLLKFASQEKMKTINKPFVVFPQIRAEGVRWRAALAVDRFYPIEQSNIKCRRFLGGKVLQLIHKGPMQKLSNSWELLLDSLKPNQQAYPAIQQALIDATTTANPLNWKTVLSIPIK